MTQPDYTVYLDGPARRDFKRLAPEHRERLQVAIRRLAVQPRNGAQKLVGINAYRVRVGTYRVIFTIDDVDRKVVVTNVKHRRDAYRRP